MKKHIVYSIAAIGFAGLIAFTSCKKKEEKKEEPAATAPDSQTGSDSRDVQDENDVAVGDVNEVISGSKRASGRSSSTEETTGICGYDVDSVKITKDTILLKYNGVTCNNRTRTGVIRLSWAAGTKWKNQNAIIKVEYLNYKVVKASNQRSYTLNGTQYLKNVSGGTWIELLFLGQSLVNTVTGTNLQVTFNDNKTAVYNINRRLTYSNPGSILTAKAEGIGSNGSLNDLENYGTDRNGDVFTSQVTTPIIWNATCGGAVIQGAVTIKNVTKSIELGITYGVDVNGNVVTNPSPCPYGWKLSWTANSNSYTQVYGY